jgi:cyclophilin family peptidyl-prolyl cis-trans isomerase
MNNINVKKIALFSYLALAILVLALMLLLVYISAGNKINLNFSNNACNITYQPSVKKYSSYPKMCIDKNKNYTATIETNYGNINVTLNSAAAPLAVNNFIFLSKSGFYNNIIFHRVIKGFMVQTGDPTGTGSGGPGYTFKDQINALSLGMPQVLVSAYEKKGYTYDTNLKSIPFSTGVLAMANSGPNTNGSQFFITLAKDTQLNGLYTVFGKVTSGMSVVEKIGNVPVNAKDHHRPYLKIYIKKITINN